MRERAIVVGAGVGGLTTAALLAADDFDVTLVEAQATPGGKLRAIDGIDAGPTVFTMRDVFDDLFESCGERLDDHLVLKPASVLARHAWSDGGQLDLFADAGASTDAIGRFAGAAAAHGYTRFRAEARRIHDALDRPFLRASRVDPLRLGWRMGAAGFRDYCSLRPYESLWHALGGYFPDPRLRQLFGRYTTYCGSSPFRSPATLMLIADVEARGVSLVEGGMHRLAGALATLADNAGVRTRYDARVNELVVERGRAAGVTLADGERIAAERVVIAGDPSALATGRFGEAAKPAVSTARPAARSLSALVWLARGSAHGMALDRHNVLFSDDYRAEFDALGRGQAPSSPSVYVCAQGNDGYQIIVNAPPNGDEHHYSKGEVARCQAHMLATLARCGVQLELDDTRVLTPNDFEALNPSTGGALYGRASHGWAASFLRQGSRTRIPGLYCAGGSCHPGSGVPMAALSGRLAAACLHSDRASTARSRRGAIAGGTSMRSATTAGMG